MSEPSAPEHFPRKILIAFGSLIGLSLLLVTAAVLTGYDPSQVPPSPTVASRDLRFSDSPDGTTLVQDVADGRTVAVLPSGIEGFVRGILRAVSRERHNRRLPDDTPFRLSRLADGRLTLTDLGTHKIIVLNSFGPTNEASFAVFLAGSAGVAGPTAPPDTVSAQAGAGR
ncbi:photosynthetic complex assembly protein PuhC [uncultured Thiodictyon sp.]|uniref:photosynthetic complex assembly protein PuhC n=1 Tax=uncultured Thiodictyon sp. TaxID=1846217 RepID=UPI0025DDB4E0|nr:photosynthetic complex assembly protein PuhC [uncultured Thiodictyon sp.]